MFSNSEARTTQKKVFAEHSCECVCRYEKASGKTLAWFKRRSNRVARRRLKQDLRHEVSTS